jgi:hypothetical protein
MKFNGFIINLLLNKENKMEKVDCELTGTPLAVLNAITGRAEYLYHIVKAMDEAGIQNTDEILKKAIYEVGKTWGEKLGDVESPREFWNGLLSEDLRKILKLDWVRDQDDEAELHFYRCPLVYGWKQMGLDDGTIARLCAIANQVDYGNVESFGFELDMDPGLGNGGERCTLIVKKGK